VLVCVGYDEELRKLLAASGELAKMASGTIVAILSTVHPRTVVELAKMALERGVHVVDTTVCRGSWAADEGTLLSFVGGEAAVVEQLRPVLAAYSTDIVHTGPVGTAQVAKAANNMIMWSCLIANHEALALAKRFGMDPERLREALSSPAPTTRCCATGGRTPWRGRKTTWTSCRRWPPSAASGCRRRVEPRDLPRAQAETVQAG
jgi:3-hydroxyisobutyrate dehydrogenase-like beta-hydroxyacid dehydrogenase